MRLFGGDGNDRLSLAGASPGEVFGMGGDDVLIAAGAAGLDGGPGNDQLMAQAASALAGGSGTDRLDGSPQDDVLVRHRRSRHPRRARLPRRRRP